MSDTEQGIRLTSSELRTTAKVLRFVIRKIEDEPWHKRWFIPQRQLQDLVLGFDRMADEHEQNHKST